MTRALSASPFAAALLAGPTVAGTAVGHGFVLFGDRVLAVTRPNALRMPNGIEADLELSAGESVLAGDGALQAFSGRVTPGPLWDPRPVVRFGLSVSPRPQLRLGQLAGSGPGLTPLGDDVLVGYLAGLVLSGGAGELARAWAERAARGTTALSGTLLRLAGRGCLPEAAHALLERGDPEPLLGFGATSGAGIAIGLALADGSAKDDAPGVDLAVPLAGTSGEFELRISPLACRSSPQRRSGSALRLDPPSGGILEVASGTDRK